MPVDAPYLSPAEAARQLGISTKALRLYEQRRLLGPARTRTGWRLYGPAELARAQEIVALRALGLTLTQVAAALSADAAERAAALTAHQGVLEGRARTVVAAIAGLAELRSTAGARAGARIAPVDVSLSLPWPWDGERLELRGLGRINYLTGPLGSGKTRLALRIAEAIPGACFVGLDRSVASTGSDMANAAIDERVAGIVGVLVSDGATASDALIQVLRALASAGAAACVVDMIEEGLDRTTQVALAGYLRRHWSGGRLFQMTRSNAMLELASLGPDETIIYCPANHSLPMQVLPFPGSPGYEAVVTCLAPPDVRARTAGVVAARPSSVAA